MANKLILTRNQIAAFVGDDPRAIKQIEKLLAYAQDAQEIDVDGLTFDVGAALAGVDKLAGIVAKLAQDGAVEASTALSVAEGAFRAVEKLADVAKIGATLPPPVPKRRNVGAWHDMTRQLAAGVNTPTRMTCKSTDLQRGIWVDSGRDVFYVADAGIYNVEFSAQIDRNKGTDSEIWFWLAVNGSDVPETASVMRIKGTDGELVAAWNFLVELQPGASVSVIWATDDLDTYLETFAASAFAPAVPSAIITITQEA